MKPNIVYTALILAILLGCHSSQQATGSQPGVGHVNASSAMKVEAKEAKSDDVTQWDELKSYLTQENPSSNQVQTIQGPCVVLVYPSDEQIQELKKEYGDSDTETIADDGNFYMSNVIKILGDLKIRTVVAKQRFIRIKGKKSFLIDLRKQEAPQFNLILCSATNSPTFRVPIDIEKAFIENYFGLNSKSNPQHSGHRGKPA